jgi:hypothetical protein
MTAEGASHRDAARQHNMNPSAQIFLRADSWLARRNYFVGGLLVMADANKSTLRAEVELLTQMYLEGGGRIEKVPAGKEALVEMTAQERVRAFSFHRPKCSHHPWKNGIFA